MRMAGSFDDQFQAPSIRTFTGQWGYAWSHVLPYAKGGAAVVDTASLIVTTNGTTPLEITSTASK